MEGDSVTFISNPETYELEGDSFTHISSLDNSDKSKTILVHTISYKICCLTITFVCADA